MKEIPDILHKITDKVLAHRPPAKKKRLETKAKKVEREKKKLKK